MSMTMVVLSPQPHFEEKGLNQERKEAVKKWVIKARLQLAPGLTKKAST